MTGNDYKMECNGIVDCFDGSDESNCDNALPACLENCPSLDIAFNAFAEMDIDGACIIVSSWNDTGCYDDCPSEIDMQYLVDACTECVSGAFDCIEIIMYDDDHYECPPPVWDECPTDNDCVGVSTDNENCMCECVSWSSDSDHAIQCGNIMCEEECSAGWSVSIDCQCECYSNFEEDGIWLTIQNIDTVAGTFEIYMNSNVPIAGYQFHMNGINVDGLSGGLTSEYGWGLDYRSINSGEVSTILAFDTMENYIPAGAGVLLVVHFSNFYESEISIDTEGVDPGPIIDGYGGDGDLDFNGSVNISDLVILSNCVLQGSCFETSAELNGDGVYNVLDIVTLSNYILNAGELTLIFANPKGESIPVNGDDGGSCALDCAGIFEVLDADLYVFCAWFTGLGGTSAECFSDCTSTFLEDLEETCADGGEDTIIEISDILNGSYQGEIITTQGIIVEYIDVTPFNGPHLITIAEDSSGSTVQLVTWPYQWNDDYITLIQPPLYTKRIKVTGLVSEYEGNIIIESIASIEIMDYNTSSNFPSVTIQDILSGSYEQKVVTTDGLIVFYYDASTISGPHILYMEDEKNESLAVIVRENEWDISNSVYECAMLEGEYSKPCIEIINPPFQLYSMRVTGIVEEYEGVPQIQLNNANNFQIIDIYSCMDHSACNYNPEATKDDGFCLYPDECGECGGNNSPCLSSFGTDSTLDIITWNIETFPKRYNSTQTVYEIINALEADIISLQEIQNGGHFIKVVDELNNFESLDNWVGYRSEDSNNLELAYLINISEVEIIEEPYTILHDELYYFGREPHVLKIFYLGKELFIINNHFKCCGDGIIEDDNLDEEFRRQQASYLLGEYIENNLANENVIILGDLNDEIQENEEFNVFWNFISKPDDYLFTDMEIAMGSSESWSWPGLSSGNSPRHLMHVLITDELFDVFNTEGSLVQTIFIDDHFTDGLVYENFISDHRPLGLRFYFGDCTDPEACNYNPDAIIDNGSCSYEEDCTGDCGGSTEVDCAGDCGGSALVDECGVCGGGGLSCRAIGYLDKGEVQIIVPNYGSIVHWDGLWNGHIYFPSMSFMVGIPGKDEYENPYEWALRPNPQNPDTLVYWGPTVSESYFNWSPDSLLTDWKPVENANGTNFSGDVFVEDIYPPYNYIEEGMFALANSDYPSTWPLNDNMNPIWLGWEDVQEEIYDQNIYLELDDRFANMDVDSTQGYPIGITAQVIASADIIYNDAIIYQLKLKNQSGFNYKDLYFGIYFDVDNATGDENGYASFIHTNDDDMFGLDEGTDLVYIYDYDGQSGIVSNPAYAGVMFVNTPEDIGLTGFRWFDWYSRPGVGNNPMAGNGIIPAAADKEAIQYALLANQIDYPNQLFSDWEWRGIEPGPNPLENEYNDRYFHTFDPSTDMDTNQDPNFDSIDGIYETSYFNNGPDGLDCIAFISSGPYDINAGELIALSFAMVFGENEDDLIYNAEQIKNNCPLIGDVNNDCIFNILDVVTLVDIIMLDENYIEEGDINGDGYLNIMDVVQLVNLILDT